MLLWSRDTLEMEPWFLVRARGWAASRCGDTTVTRHNPISCSYLHTLAAIHTTHLYHAPIFHTCSYSRYVTHLTPNLMKCDLDTRYVDPEIELARKGCLLAADLLLMDGLLPRSAWRRTCNLLCSNVTLCNFSLVRKIDTSGHKKQFERGCRTD